MKVWYKPKALNLGRKFSYKEIKTKNMDYYRERGQNRPDPEFDNYIKRNREDAPSSSYQKRESKNINRGDSHNSIGSASMRSSVLRSNMQDWEDDYHPRSRNYNYIQSEFESDQGTHTMNEFRYDQGAHVGRRYQSERKNYYDPEDVYYDDRGSARNTRDFRGWESRFPEDDRYYEYRDRHWNDPGPRYGYSENQGQYSSNNYSSGRFSPQQRGGINYKGGRKEGYEGDYYTNRNYYSDRGGMNERTWDDSYHQANNPYRGHGRGTEYGSYHHESYRPSHHRYFRDENEENYRRNRRENERW